MALNPCDYACVDDTHESTRIICECPWFDARCHECPIPVLNALPPCMVECPDDDVHVGEWHEIGKGEWMFLCDDECTAAEDHAWPQNYHDGPPTSDRDG